MGTKGYDCVLIPGALKTDLTPIGVAANAFGATMFCGQSKGLGTVKSGTASKTICCKSVCTFIQHYVQIVYIGFMKSYYSPLTF